MLQPKQELPGMSFMSCSGEFSTITYVQITLKWIEVQSLNLTQMLGMGSTISYNCVHTSLSMSVIAV